VTPKDWYSSLLNGSYDDSNQDEANMTITSAFDRGQWLICARQFVSIPSSSRSGTGWSGN